MSFDAFLERVQSPALRQVALHWNAARRERAMPGWRDIDPGAIVQQLPIIWAWKYDRANGEFTGRLAGEVIATIFGRQLRGAPIREFFAGRNPENVVARYTRIVTDPAFMHCRGRVFQHVGRTGAGERIALPLADDGAQADGLIGATVYEIEGGLAARASPAAFVDEMKCAFHPLGGG